MIGRIKNRIKGIKQYAQDIQLGKNKWGGGGY